MSGYLEDISGQVEDANAAAEVDAYDERPTRAELERDDFEDWSWWREQEAQR